MTALNVNPKMIKWAREDAGFTLDELPDYLKDAEKWENGDKQPTWADLRKLAKKYKRPSFFYFLSEPPKVENDFIEFRSDEKIEDFSSNLKLEIRKAKHRRNAYLKIINNMGLNTPNFSKYTSLEKSPVKLSEHIRKFLGVDLESQKKWILNNNENKDYSHNSFLNHWKEIFFELGILVFELNNVSEEELSGCSLYYDNCPIILLNGKNTPNRRIFTLMHELVHLVQKNSSICDVDKHNQKEAFCNKVAAEILVPKKYLINDDLFYKNGKLKIANLSHIYGVSQQTIAYRLCSEKLIESSLKDILIKDIEQRNSLNKQKKIEQLKKGSSPKISSSTIKNKYDGEPYTRLILDACENKIITIPQAVKYLDTSYDNFETISRNVFGED